MNSSSPAWDVDLDVGPSRLCLGLTVVLHGAALAALAGSALPARGLGLAAVVVLAAAALAWRAESGVAARLRLVGEEWWLETRGRHGMVRQRRGRAWRWLVVLELEGEWQGRRWREKVVVWPDSVDGDAFRRLRVWLRLAPRLRKQEPGPAAAGANAAGAAAPAAASAAKDSARRAGALRG